MDSKLHWIHLKNWPILKQLELEEALLRTSNENFCIVNQGSEKTIVMGISAEMETLIDVEKAKKEKIPILKRFSGGGTVIVDENTLFVTLIMKSEAVPIQPFPEPILQWTEKLYQKSWKIPHFHLRENDYCIEDKKCGGNAQYIRKGRWLHHTSFLWDYCPNNMELLFLPPKRPHYRKDRLHHDFLTKLKDHVPEQVHLLERLKMSLFKESFQILETDPLSLDLSKEHRRSLKQIL